MDGTRRQDWLVGIFVLLGLLAIGYLSVSVGGASYKGKGGLLLIATFDEIGGLKDRAPVTMSGVKVGQVRGISLDDAYRASVEIDIDATLELPVDSSASIRTSGLLGDQYVRLELGAEEELLRSGEEIAYTEDAIVIESLIGKLIHNIGLKSSE